MLEMDRGSREEDGFQETEGSDRAGDEASGDPKFESFGQGSEVHVQEHTGGDLKVEMDGENTEHDVRENEIIEECRMGDEPDGDPKPEVFEQSTVVHVQEHGDGSGCLAGVGPGDDQPEVAGYDTKHDAGEKVGQRTLDNTEGVAFEAQDSGVHAVFAETSKVLEGTQTAVANDQSEKCILSQVELEKEAGSAGDVHVAAIERGIGGLMEIAGAVVGRVLDSDTRAVSTSLEIPNQTDSTESGVSRIGKRLRTVDAVIGCDVTNQLMETATSVKSLAEELTVEGGGEAPTPGTTSIIGSHQSMQCVDTLASAVVDDQGSKNLEGTMILKNTSQSESMKEGIACFESNHTTADTATGHDFVAARAESEGVCGSSEIGNKDRSSGGQDMENILVEKRCRDETTELHAFASNLDFETKGLEGTTSLDAVQDDIDKICITNGTNSKGASSPEKVSVGNNVMGSEFISGHGQTVVDRRLHMSVLEVKALRTTEDAELVAPFHGQDASVQAEVGEVGNNRAEISVIRDSSSNQSHQTKISISDLSRHVQTSEGIMGDREEPDPPAESERMNRSTDLEMVSMSDSDQVKVNELSIPDSSFIDKNQDVRELNNIVPSREVHESELTLSDVQGVGTVLASKEVPNVESIVSTDIVPIPVTKVPDLANLDVRTSNPESYPINENLRDGEELVSVHVGMNNAPFVEADSGDAHLSGGDNPNSIMGTQCSNVNIAQIEGVNPEVMQWDKDIRGSSTSGKADIIANACSDFDLKEVTNEVNVMKDIDKDVDEIVTIEDITEGGQGAITLEASLITSSHSAVTEMSQAGENKLLGDVDGFTAGDNGLSVMEDGQHAVYNLEYEEKARLSVSDLVWGKVKNHPWWPGQIFDSSDASELALKYQKDNFLVAYFGDKTFAWCDESQLKPFKEYFSQMVNQCSSDIFIKAVDDALEEVLRRVQMGMSCHCIPEEILSGIMYQKVENAGIRKGISSQAFDSSQIISSFVPKRFLDYIRSLAQSSTANDDRLELLITQAQVNALYRFKSFSEQPVLFLGRGPVENNASISPSTEKGYWENDAGHSSTTLLNLNSGINQRDGKSSLNKRKNIPWNIEQKIYELKEEETASQFVNGDKNEAGFEFAGTSYSSLLGKKPKIADFDSSVPQRLNPLRDSKIKPSLIGSFKIGECIRRAASQLTSSTSALKCTGEVLRRSISDDDHTNFDVSGFNDLPRTPLETSTTDMCASEEYSPSEMFAQLRFAATDPLKGYSSTSGIIHFFSDFRNSCMSDSPEELRHVEKVGSKRGRIHVYDSYEEMQQVDNVGGKRGRKKKSDSQPSSVPASSETSAPDYMSDSYWSEMLFHSSPENKLSPCGMKRRGRPSTRGQRKKKMSVGEPASLVLLAPVLNTPKLRAETPGPNLKSLPAERPIITSRKKYADESTPTELILCFNKSDSLPSETDLIRIFGRYGPLKEAETEVMRKANRVKVVFKRHADAETAFSSAGKYSIFGPTLISYRLRYLPSTPKTPPGNKIQEAKDASSDITAQYAKDVPSVPDSTPHDTNVVSESKPQEAKDKAVMDGGNLEDSVTAMQDTKDAPPDTTSQNLRDAIPETSAQYAAHVPDVSSQDTEVAGSEIKPQEAKHEAIMDGDNTEDSGTAVHDQRDAPPDITPQDVKDFLAETTAEDAAHVSDATPQVDGGKLEDSGTTMQDPSDALPDTTPQDVKESLAESTAEDATHVPDAIPQNTEVGVSETELPEAKDETVMDGGKLEDSSTTMQDPKDAPPDATPQDVKDCLAETIAEDATNVLDATPQDIENGLSYTELQEAKDETIMDGGNPEDPKDVSLDTILQHTEDALAETTKQDATYSERTPQDAKVAVSETKPQEAKDEAPVDGGNLEGSAPPVTTMQDAHDAPQDTMEQDVEEAPVESITQDATDYPDATSQDAKFSLTEIEPAEAKDETTMDGGNLEDSDVKDVPLDTTRKDMIDAVAESSLQVATHSSDTTPQNVEIAPSEIKTQEAKDEARTDGGNMEVSETGLVSETAQADTVE